MQGSSSPARPNGRLFQPRHAIERHISHQAESSTLMLTPVRHRKHSMMSLSASTLYDLSSMSSSPPSPLATTTNTKPLVRDACSDIERELRAIDARLALYRHAREQQDDAKNEASRLRSTTLPVVQVHSDPENPTNDSNSISNEQQAAGEVAEEVENALSNCERLLNRAMFTAASYASRSSISTSFDLSRATMKDDISLYDMKEEDLKAQREAVEQDTTQPESNTNTSRRYIPVESLPSPPSHRHTMNTTLHSLSPEERELEIKVQTMKSFAATCQQDMEAQVTSIYQHQQAIQSSYLKELQRKYESKKKMTLIALKERCEHDTKDVVRTTMEKYEREQEKALEALETELLKERERYLSDIMIRHEKTMDERVKSLEARLAAENLTKKKALEVQLQAEQEQKLHDLERESQEKLANWEAQTRMDMEKELYKRREKAAANILKKQETKTQELKREIELKHHAKEQEEIKKLEKALAFGAQTQLQQLRKQLETDYQEKLNDVKLKADQALENKLVEVKRSLSRSYKEEYTNLECELQKRNRLAIVELHEKMQREHQEQVHEMTTRADQHKKKSIVSYQNQLKQEQQQQLRILEQTLENKLTTRLHEMELAHQAECDRLLDDFRHRTIQLHEEELNMKASRVKNCQDVLLAEANAFLSLNASSDMIADGGSASHTEASQRLTQVKKHLSKELAKYVDILVSDFEEIAEEQRILVTKITESTQLYLTFKRECGILEIQSAELRSALHTLHDEFQKKEEICKKLYQANEALIKRLGVSVLSPTADSESSKAEEQSPLLVNTLNAASSWKK